MSFDQESYQELITQYRPFIKCDLCKKIKYVNHTEKVPIGWSTVTTVTDHNVSRSSHICSFCLTTRLSSGFNSDL